MCIFYWLACDFLQSYKSVSTIFALYKIICAQIDILTDILNTDVAEQFLYYTRLIWIVY